MAFAVGYRVVLACVPSLCVISPCFAQRLTSPHARMPPDWQVVSEPGSTRSAVRVHSVSWLELACRFVGVLPGRYSACWRMRLCGHFVFTGGRLVVRHLPATCPAAVEALASGAGDPLLPILQEDGVRGQLRAHAAPEPQEARTQLRLLTRAHLDEAFQQVGARVNGVSRFRDGGIRDADRGGHGSRVRQPGTAWRLHRSEAWRLATASSTLQAGSDWFEQRSAPFELPCISVVYTKFHSPQGKRH